MRQKQRFIIIVLLVLFSSAVALISAEDLESYHVIHSYEFDIPGKTWASMVRRDIVPEEGDPPFTSIEKMEGALEQKRRRLFNRRIFNEVSYQYELLYVEENTSYYNVVFYIDDSFTFLPIPYAKYDSNYGIRAGVRVYEKNFFGSFSDLFLFGIITQEDSSWDRYKLDSELNLNNIPLGVSSLDLFGKFAATIDEDRNLNNATVRGRVTARNLQVLNNTLSLSVYVWRNQDTSKGFDEYGNINWSGGGVRISTDIGRIFLSNQPFRFHHSGYVYMTDGTWEYPKLRSLLRLTWLDLSLLDHGYTVAFTSDQEVVVKESGGLGLNKNRFTAQLQTRFPLPLSFRYTPSLATSFDMDELFFVPENFRFSTGHSFTRGSIDWINNMREGSRLTLLFDGSFLPHKDIEVFSDRFTYTASLSYTGFWLPHRRINLSTRILGFYAHRPIADSYGNIPGEYRSFPTFIPGRSLTPADQLRGILHKEFDNGGNLRRKFGAVVNMDIMIMPVKVRRLGEGFGTLFVDIGVFDEPSTDNSLNLDDLTWYYTAGLEIRGILDKLRSYPVRASIGVDLKDLNSYLKGYLPSWRDINHEITISMELFY